jgi:hypothetical protein
MECLRSVDDRVRDQVPVKGCQLPAMGAGQGQQIRDSHLPGIEQARVVDALAVEEGEIVRPELMAADATSSCGW